MVQRKGSKVSEDAEDLTHVSLQAILLADSFATKFRPITLERPKVLLPLVGIPMIDYSLAWLESAGVEEVFVFCCAHSKQVIHHLEKSQWFKHPNMAVTTIESHNTISAGDALRLIYERNVIHGDFVLITGDTVSNMSLVEALQEHKERKKKDSNAVMTMVVKKSKPSAITHQSRLGTDELFMAINPDTKQLLYYEDRADPFRGTITLDKSLLIDNSSLSLCNDMQDCYIDICAPEVLSLFTDNFDYQHLRRHFLKGLLVDDIMGYKIYTHEIHSNYAAKVDNFRSYDTISKDIIQRWTYPLVPDIQSFGSSVMKLGRQGIYSASDIGLSGNAQIGPFTLIGKGTTIGSNSKVSNSIIGEGCRIGSNVSIEGSYIWNDVTIEDGCKLKHAIVCDGVLMKAASVLEPGVILSFKVVIGKAFVVPAYSKVSLYEEPTFQDSDEELEYADSSSGMAEIPFAPIPEEKLAEILQAADDDSDRPHSGILPPSEELVPPSNESEVPDTEDNINEYFEKEVEATFQRAVQENIKDDNVILEVNSLRLSYNMQASDCAGALFYSVMKLAVETPHSSNSELHKIVAKLITTWKKLLKYYLPSIDEEILHLLYSLDIIREETILSWESEKLEADEADKVFLKQAESFIEWLRNASEEESEEEE
ncbi:putative translation initiation factor eIF-2B subunit epsilon [Bienertia sinuspersici]